MNALRVTIATFFVALVIPHPIALPQKDICVGSSFSPIICNSPTEPHITIEPNANVSPAIIAGSVQRPVLSTRISNLLYTVQEQLGVRNAFCSLKIGQSDDAKTIDTQLADAPAAKLITGTNFFNIASVKRSLQSLSTRHAHSVSVAERRWNKNGHHDKDKNNVSSNTEKKDNDKNKKQRSNDTEPKQGNTGDTTCVGTTFSPTNCNSPGSQNINVTNSTISPTLDPTINLNGGDTLRGAGDAINSTTEGASKLLQTAGGSLPGL